MSDFFATLDVTRAAARESGSLGRHAAQRERDRMLAVAFIVSAVGALPACAQNDDTVWRSPEGLFHVTLPGDWQMHTVPERDEGTVLLAVGTAEAPTSDALFQACLVLKTEVPVNATEAQAQLNQDTLRFALDYMERYEHAKASYGKIGGMTLFRADGGILADERSGPHRVFEMFQFPLNGVGIIYMLECAFARDVDSESAATGVYAFIDSVRFNPRMLP